MVNFEPKEHTVQYCEHCDSTLVDSKDSKTGKFFAIGGTNIENEKEWNNTYFALCSKCLSNQFQSLNTLQDNGDMTAKVLQA